MKRYLKRQLLKLILRTMYWLGTLAAKDGVEILPVKEKYGAGHIMTKAYYHGLRAALEKRGWRQ